MDFEDLVGLCDKIRLSWVLTVKTTVIFLKKISLNSCLIGLDQLYTGRAGESSRTWPSSNVMAWRVEGPEFDYWQYLFFFFSSSFLLV